MADRLMDKAWERIQQKTFTKWVNSHLAKRDLAVENIETDFVDGLKLIAFLEVISGRTFPYRYDKKPRMDIHRIQNVGAALQFIADCNVKLVSIAAEDIVGKNLKLILGMIWTIIQKFSIEDISEEELSSKEALLLWCRKKTAGYKAVSVDNFHMSFQDGLAFCALINKHRPDLLDYEKCSKGTPRENLKYAFEVAERDLGIPQLLDVDDLVDVVRPDERSVMTYVAQYYHKFASSRKQEVAGRRVGRLVDMQSSIEQLQTDYNDRAKQLAEWMNSNSEQLKNRDFPDNLAALKELIAEFNKFKNNDKLEKAAEKLALEALYSSINLKLRSNNRPAFEPEAGYSSADLDRLWDKLVADEREREDALNRELERMQRLDKLQQKLNNKLEKFEKWIADKQTYLATEEAVDSLNKAKEKIKTHGRFYDEYESSNARLRELEQLNEQIRALSSSAAATNQSRLEKVTENWNGLRGGADSKKATLQHKLEIEQRKEQTRIDFAKHAKEFNRWAASTIDRINDYSAFGETLEAVEAYGAELSKNDEEIKSELASKKAFLDQLWAQVQELGIAGDLKYTVLTIKDVDDRRDKVEAALPARRAAYDEELDRQRKLEAKRLEFAEMAQSFIEHLNNRREAISALQGEPGQLMEDIVEEYDEGNPERWRLEAIEEFANEMRESGINENKHTEYNATILATKNAQFGQWVLSYVSALEDEDQLRQQYVTKANEMLVWVSSAREKLRQQTSDGTLAGVRAQLAQFTAYKTGPKAENAAKKSEIIRLFASIEKLLKKNNRPPFNPPQDNSPDDVDKVWDELEREEQQKEAALRAELARQERLAQLVKKFHSDAEELEAWAKEKEVELATQEPLTSLFAAQFAVQRFEAYTGESNTRKPQLKQLADLKSEILSLGYADGASIETRMAAGEELESRLDQLAEARKAYLQTQLETQQRLENLRSEHSLLTKDYANFIKETVQKVKLYQFAFTLEAVTNQKADVDESDKAYTEQSEEKKKVIVEIVAELGSEEGLSQTTAEIEDWHQQLLEELDARQQRYAGELERQKESEELRKKFASKAKEFVDFLAEHRSKLEAIDGDVDARITAINEIKTASSAAAANHVSSLTSLSEELKSKGIYSNPHTPFTLPSLKAKHNQYTLYVESLLSGLNEANEMETRIKAQEAANAEIEKREELVLEFSKRAREFNTWLESTNDFITEPIVADSIEEAEELQSAFQKYEEEQQAKDAEHADLVKLVDEMKQNGVTDFSGTNIDDLTAKYNATLAAASDRKTALSEELERQRANEELRLSFAKQANGLHDWMSAEKAALGAISGPLEEQSATITALQTKYESEGKALLRELEATNVLVEDALIKGNRHTQFSMRQLAVEFEEFGTALDKQDKLISNEILSKKNSGVSPDQLSEFKEVFHYFDKSGNGRLNRLEFKACLQSLGHEFTEQDVDQFMASCGGEANFDQFLAYMIEKNKDTDSADEILESFKALANENDYVTAEQLRSVLSNDKVDYLLAHMPKYPGVENAYDYKAWTAQAYGGK